MEEPVMLSNIFYYLFYSSAVLIYGVGLDKLVRESKKPRHLWVEFCGTVICVMGSVLLTYLVKTQMLKINMGELAPFVAVLMFLLINVFLNLVVKLSSGTSISEYTLSLLCVIFGICESGSILDCLLNSFLCVVSFYLTVPIIHALRKRIEMNGPNDGIRNLALLFMSLAVAMLALISWNVSWMSSLSLF